MSFLRIGVACAIFNEDDEILLSRRGDLDVWNLPTGRLDDGEALQAGAARESHEETGVIVTLERAVGAYYFQATHRLNILYAGFPVGGAVQTKTDESKANRYFSPESLPQNLFASYMVSDAANDVQKVLHIHITPIQQVLMLRLKLARRWLWNLLRGRLEPKHVRFDVRAVAVIWNPAHKRILTMAGAHEQVLPFVQCNGTQAPWVQLSHGIRQWFHVQPQLHWVGVWQQPGENRIEFVFATTIDETQLARDVTWTASQNSALIGRDAAYVQRIKSSYPQEQIWTIIETDTAPAQVRLPI